MEALVTSNGTPDGLHPRTSWIFPARYRPWPLARLFENNVPAHAQGASMPKLLGDSFE
jgi:hypothetical protein